MGGTTCLPCHGVGPGHIDLYHRSHSDEHCGANQYGGRSDRYSHGDFFYFYTNCNADSLRTSRLIFLEKPGPRGQAFLSPEIRSRRAEGGRFSRS